MKTIWNAIKGYKTYFICALWLVYTVEGIYFGKVDVTTNPTGIILPLAIAALRHGLSTELINAVIQVLSQQQVTPEPAAEPETPATPQTVEVDKVLEAIKGLAEQHI